jgi:hypothetical protein
MKVEQGLARYSLTPGVEVEALGIVEIDLAEREIFLVSPKNVVAALVELAPAPEAL